MIDTIRTILFVGRPGSGKETQATLLAEKTGFEIFSTGSKFRELREEKSALGERVRETVDKGLLLPHWLASYLFQTSLLHVGKDAGIIYEGTGRRLPEAELFDEVATWLKRPYRVINLHIGDEEAIKRQVGRGRADSDSEEKVRVRLAEYDQHTAPVIDFFEEKGVLLEVQGERPVEVIHEDIIKILGVS